MQIIKYPILLLILFTSAFIGKLIAQKYSDRLEELEEIKNAFNILKSKIRFSYEPIPEIFQEIEENTTPAISSIFKKAKEKMKEQNESTGIAWEKAVEETKNNLNQEDKQALKSLSKLLGVTDVEGQISQIEVTENFLEKQIKEAEEEKQKNEKLYKRLGTTIGLAIVIILI